MIQRFTKVLCEVGATLRKKQFTNVQNRMSLNPRLKFPVAGNVYDGKPIKPS